MPEYDIEAVKQKIQKHNQQHLLAFCDQLRQAQKRHLLDQITQLDLDEIESWIDRYVKTDQPANLPKSFEPAPFYPAIPKNPDQQAGYDRMRKTGQSLIQSGKVAAFVVAGGQGTRLGFEGPKGNFPISPVKNKTLFRIFAEKILAASRKYSIPLRWYIMTSPLNYDQTVATFKDQSYFGLEPDNIFIFQQGTNPNFSFDGRILLADKDAIACSPDGHGGSLKALYKSLAVKQMAEAGIEYISYFQVDNPLINIFDPLFIGLHAETQSQMSSKALKKSSPLEKVGNFCLVNGRVTVIEYSDLPDEQAHKRNSDGSLVFELGSIAIHIISRSFVEQLNDKGFHLPLHKAVKKIPHIDSQGNHIEPEKPNGIKLESFVFDALPMARNSAILETIREKEFAPVKNAQSPDSPHTCRELMINKHLHWLEDADVNIPRNPDGSANCVVEISPLFALTAEELRSKKSQLPPAIEPGQSLYIE